MKRCTEAWMRPSVPFKIRELSYILFHSSTHFEGFCVCVWGLTTTTCSSEMIRSSTPFPLVSLFFMFVGFVLNNIGHVRPNRSILAFVSGIFFILSGVLVFIPLWSHVMFVLTPCYSFMYVCVYFTVSRHRFGTGGGPGALHLQH